MSVKNVLVAFVLFSAVSLAARRFGPVNGLGVRKMRRLVEHAVQNSKSEPKALPVLRTSAVLKAKARIEWSRVLLSVSCLWTGAKLGSHNQAQPTRKR